MKIRPKSSIIRHIPVIHGGKDHLIKPDVIDFSSNITPIGVPKSVKTILKKNLDNIQRYPDYNSSKVISSLTKYIKLDKRYLLVGNGAIEIIYNFCFAFLSKNTKVLIPVPTFQEYELAAKLNNCKVSYFTTMNLSENLDQFLSKIPKQGCVFLCNPNNPTGKLLSKNQILVIIKTAKNLSSIVFIDECFIEMVPDSNQSTISYVKKYDNVFVLRSLTKSFGLAGIRIGYAASSKQMIEILQKIKIPWSVNSLAQDAASIALKNKSHIKKSNYVIKKELNYLMNAISQLNGFNCYDSTTNFILIKTKHNSTKLQQKLLKHKILIRDCKNFRGLDNHHIRIAVKSHKDNLKLVRALEKIK
ncbi:MAG: histidinol-phosphate transaminase [Nitrosopumilus sp.]|nr:histidinol-phosphate transaminase [Nitrosopumilus sp.]MDH3490138.1 histidinol-phosphate transaminase [Nitrosopumilus sp.]MDH3517149.1 histidinol-phosphate transaminase [Nitrosopumilus sp.]MDH3565089.1 histidinol-phosphate transaminase [Nitrosopumilus sp.]MDH5555484.1 histidinol-phosphate transaminase [Nitrosopumilus sp.]